VNVIDRVIDDDELLPQIYHISEGDESNVRSLVNIVPVVVQEEKVS
jgi:hypothetical protein